MAGILRESCLEIIDKTYEAINSSLDGKNVDSNIWLKDLSARMERINRLRKKKDYLETIKCLDRDGLQEYFNLVGRMARELRLPIYRCFVDMEIAEEQELLTLYANGVVHERGKSIEIDQGMRIRFRLESKNQDAKQRVEVEWDKKRKGKGEQEGFYEALNDIKNMVDTDSLDREFAFEQVGEYKVSAAVYKYMKKSLVKKIKTLAQEYECTVIVNEGEELYEGMEFRDKLWAALSAVDWKGVVQDSMFDVTSQLPIMVGTIVLLSGVLIAISMSPIGWLAPLVGTTMQVFGLSGAVEDVVKGIYMFTDAVLRIRDAKSKAGMMQATQHLEESFRQVAPSLMLDVLLFLGGKRVAGNPTASDLVQSTPKTKTKPQVRLGERDEILDTLNKKPDIKLLGEAGGIQDLTTGTVWDNITPTQNFYPNTKIPKSFEIKVNGQKIWVHGNATEHIYEDVYAKHIKEFGTAYTNPDLYTQQLVSDFYGSLEYVMVSGIEYGHIISAGNWDFIFVPPREKELLPVIKHAQFKGWK